MSVIYEPRGRAREYSPLALNLYTGCDHRCRYCFGPRVLHMPFDEYMQPRPRQGLARAIEQEIRRLDPEKQILLCFIGDPYCQLEVSRGYTREALEILWWARNPVAILTKGGRRCLRDLGVFRTYGSRIKVGATLTFLDPAQSLEWEPGAALPEERIRVLEELHTAGVRTWVSMEPVVDPEQSLELLKLIPFVDEIRLGKLNDYQDLDQGIDWGCYLEKARAIAGDRGVVKSELAAAAGGAGLKP